MRCLFKPLGWTSLLISIFSFSSNTASSRDLFCQQFGAEAVIITSRLLFTTSPASTFTASPEVMRGCVIRRKYLSELLKELLVPPDQVLHCNKDISTFAYAQAKNGELEIFCVDHIYK